MANFDVSDFNVPVRYSFAGDFFKLSYRREENGPLLGWDYTAPAGYTIQNLIDYYVSALCGVGLSPYNQLELLLFEFWPHHYNNNEWRPLVTMDLKQIRVEMLVVSSLKMQNRSVSDTGSSSTDVINTNPLIGRSYGGYGTGTTCVSTASLPAGSIGLHANGSDGLIVFEGTSQFLKEPPLPKDFNNVKYSSKISINPGEVRTHTLVSKHNMFLNSYIRAYGGNPSNQLGINDVRLGKFNFIGLERMLYDGSEENPISVAFEIDLKIKARAYPKILPKSTTINTVSG